MARIMAIDYGGKRTGIAVTDPLQIIATGLTTIASEDLIPFLKKYTKDEIVELMLSGDILIPHVALTPSFVLRNGDWPPEIELKL